MSHIPFDERLPGITGLAGFRKDSAHSIRELTQFLLSVSYTSPIQKMKSWVRDLQPLDIYCPTPQTPL